MEKKHLRDFIVTLSLLAQESFSELVSQLQARCLNWLAVTDKQMKFWLNSDILYPCWTALLLNKIKMPVELTSLNT